MTRRELLSSTIVAAAMWLGTAPAAEPASAFKVGMTRRQFVPAAPYAWRGDPKHVLVTMIWYLAAPDAQEKPQTFGPPRRPFFDIGRAAVDAALAPSPSEFPLVVLSHGSGATAANMAWLGTALAAHGYIAAAVNHPGNNAIDGYTVPGFTLWWLRARDLSAVIDSMLKDPTFGPRIGLRRIGAAGHSLGGYTVIAIAGGITSLAHFREFCASPEADRECVAPTEFPDLGSKAGALAKGDLEAGRTALPRVCNDRPGVDRAVLLAKTAGIAEAFFARHLR